MPRAESQRKGCASHQPAHAAHLAWTAKVWVLEFQQPRRLGTRTETAANLNGILISRSFLIRVTIAEQLTRLGQQNTVDCMQPGT